MSSKISKKIGAEKMNTLEAAIMMELAGEQYYKEQATLNQGNVLEPLFVLLAEEESAHARKLQANLEKLPTELAEDNGSSKAASVFKDIRDFKTAETDVPMQLDVYRFALTKEEESIRLYENLLLAANDDATINLLNYLVVQEKAHYALFEELVHLVRRPEEWVEAPEFGRREEY